MEDTEITVAEPDTPQLSTEQMQKAVQTAMEECVKNIHALFMRHGTALDENDENMRLLLVMDNDYVNDRQRWEDFSLEAKPLRKRDGSVIITVTASTSDDEIVISDDRDERSCSVFEADENQDEELLVQYVAPTEQNAEIAILSHEFTQNNGERGVLEYLNDISSKLQAWLNLQIRPEATAE